MVSKVYALGGSVISENFDRLEKIASAVEGNEQVAVVVGAGHLKKHQEAVRGNVNNAELDQLGIAATRLNAKTLSAVMENSHPSVPETLEEIRKAAASGKDIVAGGLNPGFSTDAVAALLAELFETELLVATDVDGIYTEDPENNPDAERLERIQASELAGISIGENEPGNYSVVDGTAARIISRSDIPTKVFEGSLEKLENPEECEGTRIV